MIRTCVSCGTQFYAENLRKTKCKKDCGRTSESRNKARTEKREVREFIGIDGEGVTRQDGTHEYVLLSVGQESLWRKDGNALHWREILSFLYKQYRANPSACYVGYFLGYDFTQWFKSLSESRARSLLTKEGIAKRTRQTSGGNPIPFPVHLGNWEWEIDILGNKRFMLRPGTGQSPNSEVKNNNKWMIICDVGSFFQMSFLNAINPSKWTGVAPIVTPEEYEIIKEGKERRSTAVFDESMIRYNILENDVLGRLMPLLNDGFKAEGIALNRRQWFGPGQAAQSWMSLINAPTGETIRECVPEWARDAARETYYGGWFEIFRHGMIPGTTYEYDINSAYPYIISQLPCLEHGEWHYNENATGAIETGFLTLLGIWRMCYGTAKGSNIWAGTLPHRTPKGRVLRPHQTRGWYWEHEIRAAIAAGMVDKFEVEKTITYLPCKCPFPFEAIADLYQKRLSVGKNTPTGKAYKLIYNSAYGKMAQSIGTPKFANAVYASLITAGCRTMILSAIATHPNGVNDLLMVATDGVYFRSRHSNLPLSPETLGAWDETTKTNLTLFMPGIYWDDKSRQKVREGKAPELKSRGISAIDLANCIDDIDRQFASMHLGDPWPSIELPVQFNMVSATQALARNKWETAGDVITDGTKKLNANPVTKRNPEFFYDAPGSGIWATFPYLTGDELDTTPYEQRFGDELEVMTEEESVMTPDGMLSSILPEMLNAD